MGKHDDPAQHNGKKGGGYDPDKVRDPRKDTGKHGQGGNKGGGDK
jgi:hypothetical protein